MKNFFDCKDEKITEKAFSHSLIISVFSILMCLILLCSVTYAWFSADVSSKSNTLTSGSFDVKITVSAVEDGVATASNEELTEDPTQASIYICTLNPGTYQISLELTEGSTVKGHCVVKIGNGAEQHTAAIIGDNTANVDENTTKTNPFTFKITVTEETTVTLEPRWGVVATPDIQKDKTYSVDTWEEVSTQETEP